jgi:hypothetical protein
LYLKNLKKDKSRIKPVLIGAGAGAAVGGIAGPRTMEHESGYGGPGESLVYKSAEHR